MIGVRCPSATSRSCKSAPFMPGICMSQIKQAVSATRFDLRYSSAEANVSAAYPIDRMSPLVDSRTNPSSSTIEIRGTFGKLTGPSINQGESLRITIIIIDDVERLVKLYLSIEVALRRRANAQGLSHPYEIRERPSSHLPHDATAMDLDRDFAEPDFAGNLLVHES
jgi:hypothetical protein